MSKETDKLLTKKKRKKSKSKDRGDRSKKSKSKKSTPADTGSSMINPLAKLKNAKWFGDLTKNSLLFLIAVILGVVYFLGPAKTLMSSLSVATPAPPIKSFAADIESSMEKKESSSSEEKPVLPMLNEIDEEILKDLPVSFQARDGILYCNELIYFY